MMFDDLPMKHGDFPVRYVKSSEGNPNIHIVIPWLSHDYPNINPYGS